MESSGPEATAALHTALDVAAAAASAAEQQPTNISLCTVCTLPPHNHYKGILAILLHSRAFTLRTLSVSPGAVSPGGARHLRLLSMAQETPLELPQ